MKKNIIRTSKTVASKASTLMRKSTSTTTRKVAASALSNRRKNAK